MWMSRSLMSEPLADACQVLEVSKTADTATITKAYRRLARKKHPDKGGDPEEFKALAEAYEVRRRVSASEADGSRTMRPIPARVWCREPSR